MAGVGNRPPWQAGWPQKWTRSGPIKGTGCLTNLSYTNFFSAQRKAKLLTDDSSHAQFVGFYL